MLSFRSRNCALAPMIRAASQALGAPATGDLRWLMAGDRDLDYLTDTDRELIAVVTGERIAALPPRNLRVSFFTLQIALDRRHGALRHGHDVGVEYLEKVYCQYERHCPEGSPVSGDLLDIGLAYLVGRELAAQERDAA